MPVIQNSQEITREKNLVGCRDLTENFLRTVELLGDRREFPSGHRHLERERDDLRWWSGVVDRFLGEGRTVFAYTNNHYQNYSPSTLERFIEIRRGHR